jgi:hypothetical protein
MRKREERCKSSGLSSGVILVCLMIVQGVWTSTKSSEVQNLEQVPDPVALFLGLKLTDNHFEDIKGASIKSLNAAYDQSKDESIKADISEISEKAGEKDSWQYSYEPHITSMFIGGKVPADATNKSLYMNYLEGLEEAVMIPAIAYLPGNIIAGIGFIDLNRVLMLNKFPHTTWLNKGMSAVYSNHLLESLGTNEDFMKDYSSQFNDAKQVSSYKVTIEGKEYTAYVVKLEKPWYMTGFTSKFYLA